jgi:hypothetical protein
METKQKYLYLLRFKDTPLIKIGEGTKDENSKYNRIQNHLKTYGHVFDLEESYEIIAPKSYSISALERQLKDITMSYYPTEEVMKDYCGKDGATEIRTVESLAKILELIEFQKKFISLSLTKGITIIKPENPVKPQKEKKQITLKERRANQPIKVDLPFNYTDTLHKWELILLHGLRPNLHKIKHWSWKKSLLNTYESLIDFYIVADVSLADDLYMNDYTDFCDSLNTKNKQAAALHRKAYDNTLKRCTNGNDGTIHEGSMRFFRRTLYSKDKKTCQIEFWFIDAVCYKKTSDARKETNPFHPKEWFKTHVYDILENNIPEKKDSIVYQ